MKNSHVVLEIALILSALLLGGCGQATTTPTASPTEIPVEISAEVIAARDAALGYFSSAVPSGLAWTGERTTPPGRVGAESYTFTADDWTADVSYPVIAPENLIYTVVVANPSVNFYSQVTVTPDGQVTAEGETPTGVSDAAGARDTAMNYVFSVYGPPEAGATPPTDWTEENITPEGLLGASTFEYTAGDWVVTVSFPIVPDATYIVVIDNQPNSFHWEGTVDAQGRVVETVGP
jgi:hypothetical protein